MATIQYTSRLVSTASDGVLVEANYIKDETRGKLQSEINDDLYSKLQSSGSSGVIYNPKGSVETYDDLPLNPNPGDVYNIIQGVTIGDKEYAPGSNFVYTTDGEWSYLGGVIDITEAKEYTDGKLQEFKTESDGKLQEVIEETKTTILEESKSYTDTKINESLCWIEDEDLFSGE